MSDNRGPVYHGGTIHYSHEMAPKATAKHTPGPWTHNPEADRGTVYAGGYPVATVEKDDEHLDGNARLIAAAPAMLETLIEAERFLTDSWPGGDDFCPHAVALRAVREAIAQAEG